MRARIKVIAAVLACVGAVLAGGWYVWRWEYASAYLEIDFLSLDRGHGAFVRLPDKGVILIDGGQSGDIVRALSGLLPFYRRSIDSVFITRPEAKYVGGLVDVLERYSVAHIYLPRGMGTSTAEEAVLSLAREKNIPIAELSAENSVELEKGMTGQDRPPVSMSVIFPDASFKFSSASPQQFVLELSYGNVNTLFTGDASKAIQNFLAKGLATSSIDVLEYANSGGASNASEKFIEQLAPKYIVIKSRGLPPKPSKKPQFTVHSYVSKIEDVAKSSVNFLSDGEKLWQTK